jgi:hypothetical protein
MYFQNVGIYLQIYRTLLPRRPNTFTAMSTSNLIHSAEKFSGFCGTRRFITHVHKNLPLDPILSHMNIVHTLTSYFQHIYLNIIFPSVLRSPKWPLPFRFYNKSLYAFLFSLVLTTCPTNLILSDFIILTILDEEHRLWSSSLCRIFKNYTIYQFC